MPYAIIDPQKTALMFFDTLNAYYKGPDQNAPRTVPPVVGNYQRIAAGARAAGIPVFYAKADHRPDGADVARLYSDTNLGLQPWTDPENEHFLAHRAVAADEWKSQVIDEIKPQPGDYVIAKHRWSAFCQTHLELSLRTRGIDTIIICGGGIDVGVASTAYWARDMDFNLIIVRDACTGSRENVFNTLMDYVFPKFARVRTTDQVLQMMRGEAPELTHPERS
jgi:nicotinamidase-related amidase